LTDIPVAGRLLASSWNRGPFPSAGDGVTVGASYSSRRRPFDVAAAPALRLVADVGDWDRSVAVMPLGQSGRPWSSHYADQIQAWRRGEAYPLAFSPEAVEAAAEAALVLWPAE
jgi:penicillin amidase